MAALLIIGAGPFLLAVICVLALKQRTRPWGYTIAFVAGASVTAAAAVCLAEPGFFPVGITVAAMGPAAALQGLVLLLVIVSAGRIWRAELRPHRWLLCVLLGAVATSGQMLLDRSASAYPVIIWFFVYPLVCALFLVRETT